MNIQNLNIVRKLYNSLQLSKEFDFEYFQDAANNSLRETPWFLIGGIKQSFLQGEIVKQLPRFRYDGKQHKIYKLLILHFTGQPINGTRYEAIGSSDDMNPWNWRRASRLSRELELKHGALDSLPARVSDEDIVDLVDFIKESGSAEGLEDYYTSLEIARAKEIINSEA